VGTPQTSCRFPHRSPKDAVVAAEEARHAADAAGDLKLKSGDAALADDFHRALRRDATRKLQTANATTTSARAPKLAPIAPTAADGTAPNSPKP